MSFCELFEDLPWKGERFEELKVSRKTAIELLRVSEMYKLPPPGYEIFLEECKSGSRTYRAYLMNKAGRFYVYKYWP